MPTGRRSGRPVFRFLFVHICKFRLCLQHLARRGALHILHLLPLLLRDEDLARLRALERPDNTHLLHLVDHTRGARIAELQPALQHGYRCLLRLENDVHSLRQQLVIVALGGLVRLRCGAGLLVGLGGRFLDLGDDIVAVLRLGVLLDEAHDLLALLVRHERALHTQRLARADGRVEHIAHADELFRAGGIENDAALE